MSRHPSRSRWTLRTHSPAETHHLGYLAGCAASGGEVLALSGELGTGKTCFVRGLAAGLGALPHAVSSPTFVFIHEYSGRVRLAHADLFRLESTSALSDLGLNDYLHKGAVVAIEWPDKAAEQDLPLDRLDIQMRHSGRTVRELCFQAYGSTSASMLTRLRRLVDQSERKRARIKPVRRGRVVSR